MKKVILTLIFKICSHKILGFLYICFCMPQNIVFIRTKGKYCTTNKVQNVLNHTYIDTGSRLCFPQTNITTLSNFYRLIFICVFAFIGNQSGLWRNQLLKLIKNLIIKIQSILFIHPYCPQSGPEVIKLFHAQLS